MARSKAASAAVLLMFFLGALPGCGGDDSGSPEQASCSIERSPLGPFSADTAVGSSMSEDEALARMAQDDIVEWVAITAVGPWDDAWQQATDTVGQGIHQDLSWLDVNGRLTGLYQADDSFEFAGLRVSRSFQGKIEHNNVPLYLPIQQSAGSADFGAACVVDSVVLGDQQNEALLDLTDSVRANP